MSMSPATPELLMPAGDFEKLKFAFAYGADAVYAGVPIFSLRARENDFNVEEVRRGIEYAHRLGRKIYLTMNIYPHNSKVSRMLDAFEEMAALEPDGFIMTDAGMIAQALRRCPNAVIHLSTQANAVNWPSVEFWRDIGVKRVILSRELAITEIAEIHSRVPDVELEAFVHGSICIAYSGRCLISNYLNHRDANQGTCTNSCRWKYELAVEGGSLDGFENASAEETATYKPLLGSYAVREDQRPNEYFPIDEDEHGSYLMNSKDLCAVELLKDLWEAGVVSFKVEGRSKSIYYAAIVARAYRRAIDDMVAGQPFDTRNLAELVSTSNRTLMTGFLRRRPEEYGQNYSDGRSDVLTHSFAGQVVEHDAAKGIAWVELKHKVSVGDAIEWVTPHATCQAVVTSISTRDGATVDTASSARGVEVGLPCPLLADPFTLLRRQEKQDAVAKVAA